MHDLIFGLIYTALGLPNGLRVLAESNQWHRASKVRMVFRLIIAGIAVATWFIAALYVYYRQMFAKWPTRKKDKV